MITINQKTDCCGCWACMNICPQQCITMQSDTEGFLYPTVNQTECINCHLCEKHCPILNNQQKKYEPLFVYGCRNLNSNSLKKSSSGGIFELLAKTILAKGGIVFGAKLDNSNKVVHTYIDTIKNIDTLRRSKYVQSEIGNTYCKTKKVLDDGRPVLFTGTPCQIAGLQAYLKREYKKLFTVDFICHGVPSPAVWRKYLDGIEANSDSTVSQINFRDKRNGWLNYHFSYSLPTPNANITISEARFVNPFIRGFLYDLYLRPSCHDCKFKHFNSGADITLSDFWGVWMNYPKWNDNRGASCAAINTKKGEILFNTIDKGHYEKINLTFKQAYIDYNKAALKSTAYNAKREIFFNRLSSEPLVPLIMSLTQKTLLQQIRDYISIIMHKSGTHKLVSYFKNIH